MKPRLAPALLLGLALLASPAPAGATYDQIGGGTTRLVLDREFTRFAARAGVKVAAGAPAVKRGRALVLPISGGNLDPTLGMGQIDQEGTIVLSSARRRIPLRRLSVRTKRTPLIAKVGGSQLKVATSSSISSRRDGFGTAFSAKRLELTAKVATRLNKKLRPRLPFEEGQAIGTVLSRPQPLLATVLPQGRATVALDPGFVAKLDEHFVSVNPIFPAEHEGPSFTLPMTPGGALAPDGAQGTLRTGGALEFLQLGAGQVFWREPWFEVGLRRAVAEVDVEPTPAFPGKLGQVPIVDLAAAPVATDPRRRTIAIAGAVLTLQQASAAAFNQAFAAGKEDFRAGEPVGTLTFAAQGQ